MKRPKESRPESDDAARLYITSSLAGSWMEPTLSNGSTNLFGAGTVGAHAGPIVCVGRFANSGPLESRSVGIVAVTNPELGWHDQRLRLEFLNVSGKPIFLDDARYRIVSEWVTSLDPRTYKPVQTRGVHPPAAKEAPEFDKWLSMSPDQIVRVAAFCPTPPEVFAKFSELVDQNPILSQTVMTKFCSCQRWIYSQPAILEDLSRRGQRVDIPGGSSVAQMIAKEWTARGNAFKEWYEEVIEPMLSRIPG